MIDATKQANTMATPLGRVAVASGGRQARKEPLLVEQQQEARCGEDDQQGLRVGEREHKRPREHCEQDHRPCSDSGGVHTACQKPDEDDADGTEDKV